MFDRRKYINYLTLNNCREYFFDRLKSLNITMDVIVGNHDVFYKNTNSVNSPELLLKEYGNVKVFKDPTVVELDYFKILYLPWITSDNYKRSMELMETTSADVCFGHLEIAGFQMYKGHKNDNGYNPKLFERFDLVCSGHFHHRSRDGNIQYLGNPYELTWADYGDVRGFHTFDTQTRELEFIRNPFKMFYKIQLDLVDPEHDYKQYEGAFVKLIVSDRDNPALDIVVDQLQHANVADLQIVDDHKHLDLQDEEEIINDTEDTLTILSKFCESLDTTVDKPRLQTLMKNLYHEALNTV